MAGLEAPLMVAWQACGRDEGGGSRGGAGGAALGGQLGGGAPMEGGLQGEALPLELFCFGLFVGCAA
jgi:hypothetical protein